MLPMTAYNAHDCLLHLRPRTLLITTYTALTTYASTDCLLHHLHCGHHCPHAIAEGIKHPVSVSDQAQRTRDSTYLAERERSFLRCN